MIPMVVVYSRFERLAELKITSTFASLEGSRNITTLECFRSWHAAEQCISTTMKGATAITAHCNSQTIDALNISNAASSCQQPLQPLTAPKLWLTSEGNFSAIPRCGSSPV